MTTSPYFSRPVIGFDTETHLIRRDNITPHLVCATFAGGEDTFELAGEWFDTDHNSLACVWYDADSPQTGRKAVLERGEWELVVPAGLWLDFWSHMWAAGVVFAGFNSPFDLGVMDADAPGMMPVFLHMVDQGLVRDVLTREQLYCIATDNLQYDRRLKLKRENDNARIALWQVVLARWGVDIRDGKQSLKKLQKAGVPKSQWPWRYRYDELDGDDLCTWPREALVYAAEDATWTRRCFLHQASPIEMLAGVLVNDEGDFTDELPQTRSGLALHLMAAHGVVADPARVEVFEREVRAAQVESHKAARAMGVDIINNCRMCRHGVPDPKRLGKTKWYSGGTGMVGTVPHLSVCPNCGGQENVPGPPPKSASRRSTGRLRAWVEHFFGGEPPLTEQGATSISRDTLLLTEDPRLKEMAMGGFYDKLVSTYLPILRLGAGGGRITSSPCNLKRTGRTSWSDPNWQNPPQKGGFRDCIVPRAGMVYCSTDYTSQEMVCLAQVNHWWFGDECPIVMLDAINEGRDLHLWFGAMLLDISYEEAERRYAEGDAEMHRARQMAKPANFGFPGGMGVNTFIDYARGYGVILDLDTAHLLRKTWLAAWPEMARYLARFSDLSNRANRSGDGTFEVAQLPSGRIRGGCYYTSGANTMFQGFGADATKAANWTMTMECWTGYSDLWPNDGRDPSPLLGCRPVFFIHDELVVEGPEETCHLWGPRTSEVMVAKMQEMCPDVTVRAEPALMPRWLKSAAPAWVDGKLVPWYPGMSKSAKHYTPAEYEEYRRTYEEEWK